MVELVDTPRLKSGFPLRECAFDSETLNTCSGGGTGRHAGLKILFPSKECGFDSRPEYRSGIFQIEFWNAAFFLPKNLL